MYPLAIELSSCTQLVSVSNEPLGTILAADVANLLLLPFEPEPPQKVPPCPPSPTVTTHGVLAVT
jgi:hypothetical protein